MWGAFRRLERVAHAITVPCARELLDLHTADRGFAVG